MCCELCGARGRDRRTVGGADNVGEARGALRERESERVGGGRVVKGDERDGWVGGGRERESERESVRERESEWVGG